MLTFLSRSFLRGLRPMKTFSLKPLAFAALLAVCAAPVLAQDDGVDNTVPEILHTQHALRAKLDNPTGEYSRFSADDLAKMRHAQDQVFRMLDGVSSLDQLKEDQKIALSNALDQVKATLTNNEGNRLICYRERRMGTNLLEKRCETVDEREARTHDSQQQMQDMAREVQTRSGG
jgi:hypothetical protein